MTFWTIFAFYSKRLILDLAPKMADGTPIPTSPAEAATAVSGISPSESRSSGKDKEKQRFKITTDDREALMKLALCK